MPATSPRRGRWLRLSLAGAVLMGLLAGATLLLKQHHASLPQAPPRAPEPPAVRDLAEGRRNARRAGMDWVLLKGGGFQIGSTDGGSNERPAHNVDVKGFRIARTLTTVEQYKACVDAGGCAPPDSGGKCTWEAPGKERHPVNCVDWDQARRFSEWVGGRLPTEAEWEYAARGAGKHRHFPWGDEPATCGRAVMNDGGLGCGTQRTWPVCSKPAGNTEQGLCDMAGNLYEWVQDWYHDSYDDAPADGSAWEDPPGTLRIVRGGSWCDKGFFLRVADRDFFDPVRRLEWVGFRPVRAASD